MKYIFRISTISNRIERLSEAQFGALLLVPTFLLLGVMAIWPLFETIQMSFFADQQYSIAEVGSFVGLQNYIDVITGDRDIFLFRPFFDLSAPFQSAVIVTILFTVTAVTFEISFGFAQALTLNREFRDRKIIRTVLLIPYAIPVVIQGMLFFFMFSGGFGIINRILVDLGWASETALANPPYTFAVVVMADFWKQTPFIALLILAGLQGIDKELYQVGEIEGASLWQLFRTITLPLILPTVLLALMIRVIYGMKTYGTIVSISGCKAMPSLTCLVVETYRTSRFASAATIAVLMVVLIGIISFFILVPYLRASKRTERRG